MTSNIFFPVSANITPTHILVSVRRVRPEEITYNPQSANFTLEQLAEAGEDTQLVLVYTVTFFTV
jgi:hypothetical protein